MNQTPDRIRLAWLRPETYRRYWSPPWVEVQPYQTCQGCADPVPFATAGRPNGWSNALPGWIDQRERQPASSLKGVIRSVTATEIRIAYMAGPGRKAASGSILNYSTVTPTRLSFQSW
jgi:hypothetical protein